MKHGLFVVKLRVAISDAMKLFHLNWIDHINQQQL